MFTVGEQVFWKRVPGIVWTVEEVLDDHLVISVQWARNPGPREQGGATERHVALKSTCRPVL
jgi:hypothetical protein